jgi:hypothetical protein
MRTFTPNLYVPVEMGDAAKKLEAIGLYTGEHTSGRNVANLDRWLHIRGEQVGTELAEAFSVARWFL